MPTLFTYVVHHDFGLSPNPSGGYCTLTFCKFRRADGMPNIVELAQVGDWIAGTGGKSKLSAGHDKLVYAMKVTEKMTLWEYFRDPRFRIRNKFDEDLVQSFVAWLEDGWDVGIHGYPCAEHEDADWVGREGPDGLFTNRRECRSRDSRSKPKAHVPHSR